MTQFDRSHALWAHQIAEHWIRQGQVDLADLPNRRVQGLSAIRCTLRDAGTTAGRGDARARGAEALEAPPVNLTELVAEAVTAAQADYLQRQHNARLHAVNQGHAPADLPQASTTALADRLLLDLQFAGSFQAIHLTDQAEPDAVYAQFISGYHGLRLTRRRTDAGSLQWPATALERNSSPRSQLLQLLRRESLPVAQLVQIGRSGGPQLFRFDVLHVVRPQREAESMFFVRGTTETGVRGLDQAGAEQLAQRIAHHLAQRITREGTLRGTWLPSESRFHPQLASHHDSALAAYALTRAAGRLLRADPGHAQASEQAHKARCLAADLAQAHRLADRNGSPATAALALLALADSPLIDEPVPLPALRESLAADLLEALTPPGEADDLLHSPVLRALAIAALTAHHDLMPDPLIGRVLQQKLEELGKGEKTPLDLSVLPWYLLALERLSRWPGAAENLNPAGTTRLPDQLVQLEALQIRRAPAWGPNDQLGGIALPGAGPADPQIFPQSDWRTGHFLATLAMALRQPDLTPPSGFHTRLLAAALAAGFLDRLTLAGPALFHVSQPQATEGGVRLSSVDNRMPPAASSIALLALVELLETLEDQSILTQP